MLTAALPARGLEQGASAPPRRFSCRCTNSGQGTAYVRPAGALDLATALQLDQALISALRGARLVVLDLAGLDFIDSSGVHVIAAATAAARGMGRRLITLRGPERIHEVFVLTESVDDVEMHASDGSSLSELAVGEGARDAHRLSA
jgi:anti-sigma B factor antagonist